MNLRRMGGVKLISNRTRREVSLNLGEEGGVGNRRSLPQLDEEGVEGIEEGGRSVINSLNRVSIRI